MAARTRSSPPVRTPWHWRVDLAAGLLLVSGLIVAASLFSYHPADPPTATVFPVNSRPLNLLGEFGAHVAHGLITALGLAAHLLLAAWFVLVILLFLRQGLFIWSRRLIGWLALVPLGAVLADRLLPALDARVLEGMTLAGPGGTIGAWFTLWLRETFSPEIEALLLIAISLLVLILCADRLVWKVVRAAWASLCWLLVLRRKPEVKKPLPVRRIDAVEEDDEESPDEEEEDFGSSALEETPPPAPRTIPIRHHDRLETNGAASRRVPFTPPETYADFVLPALTLLDEPEPVKDTGGDKLLRERANLLEKTFADFGLKVQVVGINTGPVITQYEIALDVGLRVNKVTRLADDIALNLRVSHVRMVAPIPGKNTVGVEIPNEERARVRLKEVNTE